METTLYTFFIYNNLGIFHISRDYFGNKHFIIKSEIIYISMNNLFCKINGYTKNCMIYIDYSQLYSPFLFSFLTEFDNPFY